MKSNKVFNIMMGTVFALTSINSMVYAAKNALPTDVNFTHGKVTQTVKSDEVLIYQTGTDKSIATGNFDVADGHTFWTQQPTSESVALYRDIYGQASEIDGTLGSNGKIFLLNESGIMFGENAKIDTAGFVASTLDIEDKDFLRGEYHFQGDSNKQILNNANLSINGSAAFISNSVINNGEIVADDIAIGVGQDARLHLSKSIYLKMDHDAVDTLHSSQFHNTGLIKAKDGGIYIGASANQPSSFTNTGNIEASDSAFLTSNVHDIDNKDGAVSAGQVIVAHSTNGNVKTGVMSAGALVAVDAKNIEVKKINAKNVYLDAKESIIGQDHGEVNVTALKSLNAIARDGDNILVADSADIYAWAAGEDSKLDITNVHNNTDTDLYAVAHGELNYTQEGESTVNVKRAWGKSVKIDQKSKTSDLRIDEVFARNDLNIEANGNIFELDSDPDFDLVSETSKVNVTTKNGSVGTEKDPLEISEKTDDIDISDSEDNSDTIDDDDTVNDDVVDDNTSDSKNNGPDFSDLVLID